MFPKLRSLGRALLGRSRFEADMGEEIRFHMEERTRHLVSSGLPEDEARRRARLEFGSAERIREECREATGLRLFDSAARNTRFAFRLLRRDPVFSFTVIVTLALCIGANTAVYSVVDAVLVRALPYPEPDRLAQVVASYRHENTSGEQVYHTGLVWETLRDHATAARVAVTGMETGVNLAGGSGVENVVQARVSASYFGVLGVAPFRGRGFTAEEDQQGGPPVVVLSYDVWKRLFDADEGAIGKRVMLRGEPWTVVGVMPRGFLTPAKADVWTPLRASRTGEGGGSNYTILARLAPKANWAQAEAEVRHLSPGIFEDMDLPRGADVHLHLVPLQSGLTSDVRQPLLLVWGAVALVLLIGCANIASLLLARGATRTREMATRVALGGGRGVVATQLLTESLVLALVGGMAGLAVGYGVVRALGKTVSDAFGLWQPIALDVRVLGAALAITLVSVLLFGLVPALRVARVDVRAAMNEAGARGVAGSSRQWPRRILVAAQVALGLALLMGAGLLVRTATHFYTQPPGFDPHQVAAAAVSLQDARYTTGASINGLFDRSLQAIRRLPGVESAGIGLTLPYERALNLGFKIPGSSDRPQPVSMVYVTPGFFETLRMELKQGRRFTDADRSDSQPVIIMNEAFARRHASGRQPIGFEILVSGKPRTVVGVVGNVQQRAGYGEFGPMAAVPCLYVPVAQMPDAMLSMVHTWFSPRWVVRTSAPVGGLLPDLQRALSAVDPLLPFNGFRSMGEVRAESLAEQRMRAQVLGGMAVLALVLTFVGLYGLVASGVVERTHELAIRLALGSSQAAVIRAVILPVLVLAAVGGVVGIALSVIAVPVLRGLVWGVTLFDPGTMIAVVLAMVFVAMLASLVPAMRIVRLDPARALRND